MAEEKPEESAFIRSVTVGPVPERTCDLCLEELATWYEVGIFQHVKMGGFRVWHRVRIETWCKNCLDAETTAGRFQAGAVLPCEMKGGKRDDT